MSDKLDLCAKIYVAGHNGMVGSAIVRCLHKKGYRKIIKKSHAELDLTNQVTVQKYLSTEKPDQIYIAAAKVGGILANSIYPADFIYQNLSIQLNIIHSAFLAGIKKVLFLGSSCIYPKYATQPIQENELMNGFLEPTNEAYAIAKIAGIKLCESYNRQFSQTHGLDYRCIMPTNLYGPGDNFHPVNSHVVPGLIQRFHEAKMRHNSTVAIWGSGTALREFLFVDDLAEACVFLMNLDQNHYQEVVQKKLSHINVGSGNEISIKDLAEKISRIVGYDGKIIFDTSKPDGSPRKLLNSELIKKLGWQPRINLDNGLKKTYEYYLENNI